MASYFTKLLISVNNFVKYICKISINIFLFTLFRFPKWHIFATNINRNYKNIAMKMAQELPADLYVEIGAGLGDIGHQLPNALLLDNDRRVIRAAKMKHPKTRYQFFDLRKDNFQSLTTDTSQILCILAVNVLQPSDWSQFFAKVNLLKNATFIIVDVLSLRCLTPERYNWIPKYSTATNFHVVNRVYAQDKVRDIVLFEKIK